MRRVPILPTIVVLIAVAIMVMLGFWQLDRLKQKEAMLLAYGQAISSTAVTDYANDLMVDGPEFYHLVRIHCSNVGPDTPISGRNARGEAGWAHQVRCSFPYKMKGDSEADVVLGWSDRPATVSWGGGLVSGREVPSKGPVHRIIADPPLAGLQANARPDPNDIPNNHLAYAVQWFFFAGVALVIYALALRKRWRER